MRCAQCLKAEVSIIDGIPRQLAIQQCRNCERFLRPPWTKCELESRELLGLCLKRIKGLGKEVRLVDASFIWTEEHSKRVKIKITVQKEVANSSVLQQTMVVEFTIVNQQCEDCQKSFTPHGFNAIVQVRQHVPHRRTFCFLEQLILKHHAHEKVVSLKESREGLDFHFASRSHAQSFNDFVASWVPTTTKNSKQLVSHDMNSNVYQYKYTMLTEICPVCVGDLVYVPKGYSSHLSGAAPIMLCIKVSTSVRLIDPLTLRIYNIASAEYWKRPLKSVCTRDHLTEYVVLNVELVNPPEAGSKARMPRGKAKLALADIEVARARDFGTNDERMIVRSHMGSSLRPGNRVMGYDVRAINISGIDADSLEDQVADIILVRRLFTQKRGKRNWGLQRIARDREDGAKEVDDEDDMEMVRQDLEEDAELRQNVQMFKLSDAKSAAKMATEEASAAAAAAGEGEEEEEDDDDDDDRPEVPLAELLEGLQLTEDAKLPPAPTGGV